MLARSTYELVLNAFRVLKVFQDEPHAKHYGLDLAERVKLSSGALYPILALLEQHGWISGRWEQIDSTAEGRRPRRYYLLTEQGARWLEVGDE